MTILDEIMEHKRRELRKRTMEMKESSLRSLEHFSRTTSSLKAKFGKTLPFGIIAEVKRASPSAGRFGPAIVPADLAMEYEEHGASGISVVTDELFFEGSLNDLLAVRGRVGLPLLRKDFIIDPYQLVEAKAHGADAVLLIAGILDRNQVTELLHASRELSLDCLVELYDAGEINKLDFQGATFIGINNRNLRTFSVDIETTLRMRPSLPDSVTVISESGIRSRAEVERLRDAGIDGGLVGEHLVRSDSPGTALRNLLGSEDAAH